jgi:hypothetical protein
LSNKKGIFVLDIFSCVTAVFLLHSQKMKRKGEPKVKQEKKKSKADREAEEQAEQWRKKREEATKLILVLNKFAIDTIELNNKFLDGDIDIEELENNMDYDMMRTAAKCWLQIGHQLRTELHVIMSKLKKVLKYALDQWKQGSNMTCRHFSHHLRLMQYTFSEYDTNVEIDCTKVKWQDPA